MRENSSLSDFFEANISKVHKDRIYEIADKLLVHKDKLESTLYERQCEIFNHQKSLFLFDLTNFYFEGKALKNDLAKRGKSKEKRNQNPLVSLALIVDEHGFPVRSEVFEGNVGEPATLEKILKNCGLLNEKKDILPLRPTLAMDRGIATKDNLKFIRQHNFPFTVIERANKTCQFHEHFEKMEDFKAIKDAKGQLIHIKKLENQVLCVSESSAEKEQAMHDKKISRIKKDLDSLSKSISSGKIKDAGKIQQRIGRVKERHTGFDKLIEVHLSENNTQLTYKLKPETDRYCGAYVIEHDGINGDEEKIWRMYTTLTKVEKAFRCMKTDLGTRPVYHQGAERTKAHLFLSILAYHMLANIEHRMTLQNNFVQWSTMRQSLQTHNRCTVQWKDSEGQNWHKKLSSNPEPSHLDIYRKLDIRNPLKNFIYKVEKCKM